MRGRLSWFIYQLTLALLTRTCRWCNFHFFPRRPNATRLERKIGVDDDDAVAAVVVLVEVEFVAAVVVVDDEAMGD